MNTTILIEQLTVAILSSAIAIPAVQRIKGWMPSQWMVEPLSVLTSATIGLVFATYYANFMLVESLFVAFYAVIGAEGIYKLVGEKLSSYAPEMSAAEMSSEVRHNLTEKE